MLARIKARILESFRWRTRLLREFYTHRVLGRAAANWGWLARRLMYPLPWSVPYRRSVVEIARQSALGDVLMCTPALRELKRRNPKCFVRVYTRFGNALAGLPYVDDVQPFENRPRNHVLLRYEHALPPRRHLVHVLADNLGLTVNDIFPDCLIDDALRNEFAKRYAYLPRPRVVINRKASKFTRNKDWPDTHWDELTRMLVNVASVIEIGLAEGQPVDGLGEGYVDLRGKTSYGELCAALSVADLHVGPMSGPVHIAAAFRTPCVVIYGGYEHPDTTHYPGNTDLYSPVECAPCWLPGECPFARKCLSMIAPQQVFEAVLERLGPLARQPASTPIYSAGDPLASGTAHEAR